MNSDIRRVAILVALGAGCSSPAPSRSPTPAPASAAPASASSASSLPTPATAPPATPGTAAQVAAAVAAGATSAQPAGSDTVHRAANSQGRIPILEYHIVGDTAGRWERTPAQLRADFELLYARGYRPISASELVDKRFPIPSGTSPVVVTFDDASPGQFRYIEQPDGSLTIDPNSAVAIWMDVAREHPDWRNVAVFCLLPGASDGHAFFGDRGIQGQKTGWRLRKVKFLADQGFELCDHTLWHANLSQYSDAVVQEQIARGQLAIDSAVPGYQVRTFALPLGEWPKNRALAQAGSWKDPKSGRVVSYKFDDILEVAGGLQYSPEAPNFDPLRLTRVEIFDKELENWLAKAEKTGRFVVP